MSHSATIFQVDPQTQLNIHQWQPVVSKDLPPIILIHGYGEHIGRYAHVAKYLSQLGFAVGGYVARGRGLSQGEQGFFGYDDVLVDDCVAVFNYVAKQTPKIPVVIAHSMGGLTAALAIAQGKIKPAALVLSSPLLRVRMSIWQKCLLNLGLKLFKDKPIHSPAVDAKDVSRDVQIVEAYRSDPLNHAMVSPRMARWMRHGGESVLLNAEQFTMPTLLIYAGDDRVVDAAGSDDLSQLLPVDCATVRRYDDAYHEIFNEPEVERQIVLRHMGDWLLTTLTR